MGVGKGRGWYINSLLNKVPEETKTGVNKGYFLGPVLEKTRCHREQSSDKEIRCFESSQHNKDKPRTIEEVSPCYTTRHFDLVVIWSKNPVQRLQLRSLHIVSVRWHRCVWTEYSEIVRLRVSVWWVLDPRKLLSMALMSFAFSISFKWISFLLNLPRPGFKWNGDGGGGFPCKFLSSSSFCTLKWLEMGKRTNIIGYTCALYSKDYGVLWDTTDQVNWL